MKDRSGVKASDIWLNKGWYYIHIKNAARFGAAF